VSAASPPPAPAADAIPTGFWIYLVSRFCAASAVMLLRTALFWHVYTLTGSEFHVGLLGLVQFAPTLALTLVGGAVADAYDRRRVMRLAQLPILAAGATLFWVTAQGAAPLPVLYGAAFLIFCAFAFDSPARQALVPTLVPLPAFPRAVTIASTVQTLAFALGPVLAGFAIDQGGQSAAYALYVLLIAVNWVGIGFLRPVRAGGERRAPSWHGVREGLAFVRAQPVVLGCMALDMFAVMMASATALLPVYAQDILAVGPRGVGLLGSSLELGGLLVAVPMMLRPPAARPGRALLIGVAVYGLATIAFGLSRAFPLSLAAYMVVGMADQVSVVMRQTAIQLETPDALRGRVSAVNVIFIQASNQLGAARAGFVAAATSPTFAVVSGGLGALLVLALVAWRIPELRRYRLGTLRA
jgi:MFS family permease